ncbi:unnamed protein product [Closterium sp. NIES-64]|nr:unnamed protein product [Closterium sp. NIES-65]CAI6007240.1 unnamed protein product [Closterium sp. NIES-64]
MRASKRARTAPFPQRPRSTRRAAAGRAGSEPIPPHAATRGRSAPVPETALPLPPSAPPALAEATDAAREARDADLSPGHSRNSDTERDGGEEHGEADSPMALLSDDALSLALSRLPTRFALSSLAFVCRRWRRLALRHCVRELRPSPFTLRATGCFASADALEDLVRRFSSSLRAIELRPPETSARGSRRGGGGRGKGKCAAEADGAQQCSVGDILRSAPMLEEVTITSCFAGSEEDGAAAAITDDSALSVIISSAGSTNTTASGPAVAAGRGHGTRSNAGGNGGSNDGSSSGGSARNSGGGMGGGFGFKREAWARAVGVPMRPLEFVQGVLPRLPRSLRRLDLHANHFLSASTCLGGNEPEVVGGRGGEALGGGHAEAAAQRGEGTAEGDDEEQAGGGAGDSACERALPLPQHATPHDSFLYAVASSLPALRALDLDTPSRLSHNAVLHLPLALPRLTSLSLCSNAITWPTVFSLLALAPSLRCLSLVSSALTSSPSRPRRPPVPPSAPPGSSALESFPFPRPTLAVGAAAAAATMDPLSTSGGNPSALLSTLPCTLLPLSSLRLYTSPHRSVQWDMSPAHSLLRALLALPSPAASRGTIPTPLASTSPPGAATAGAVCAPESGFTAAAFCAPMASSTALATQLPVLETTGARRTAAACGSTGGSGLMARLASRAGAAGAVAAAPGGPRSVGIGSVGACSLRSLHAQHTFSASWQSIGVCCHGLTELDLSFPPRPHSPSTWGGAAAQGGLTGIEEIVLCGTLSMLPHLQRLALPSANDQVLTHVARCCPHLSSLLAQPHILATSPDASLPRCPPQPHVTDDGVRALAHGCTRLVHLSLAGCVRVGSAVRQLAFHCQQLRVLRLEGSAVDDKAVLGALFGGAWKQQENWQQQQQKQGVERKQERKKS